MMTAMALGPALPHELDSELLAVAARHVAGAGALSFCVGDRTVTYRVRGAGIEVSEEPAAAATGDAVVRLSAQAWADLVGQVRTAVNLLLAEELTFERGGFGQLADWDPALRYLHAGIPPYDPTRADLAGRDPSAGFTLDAPDDELREQLRVMGVLHVRGVFSREEMAAADAEIDRLAALARPGDDESWWATTPEGEEVLCRLVYSTLRSEVLAGLERDPRVSRLGTLLDPSLRIAPDRMEGQAVLIKVPGQTGGLSNIPWHQDCGMGGHAVFCPSVSVGIQITGSSAATGNLRVVPGSHGQTLHHRWERRIEDVPVVEIDTEPGDVTVHIQDVMHASPQPTGEGGRRTMYVTHYPRTLWEHVGPGEAFNDLIRNRTQQAASLA
jgi:hypothetical protein